jgi:hypothetical protein
MASVPVVRRLRVGLLRQMKSRSAPHRSAVRQQRQRVRQARDGCEVIDLASCATSWPAEAAFTQAAQGRRAIITSGGVA